MLSGAPVYWDGVAYKVLIHWTELVSSEQTKEPTGRVLHAALERSNPEAAIKFASQLLGNSEKLFFEDCSLSTFTKFQDGCIVVC